ncbi:MAG: hypothetical protein ACRD1H_08005 [Vicinamibacterales bacterium]
MGLREWWDKLTGKGLQPGGERGFRDADTPLVAASETNDDSNADEPEADSDTERADTA